MPCPGEEGDVLIEEEEIGEDDDSDCVGMAPTEKRSCSITKPDDFHAEVRKSKEELVTLTYHFSLKPELAGVIPLCHSLCKFFTCSSTNQMALDDACSGNSNSVNQLLLPSHIRWMGNEIMLQQVLSLKIEIKIALVQLGAEAIQLPWESFAIIKEILALFSHWTGILESRNMVTISQVFVAYTALKNFLDAAQKINLSPFAADVVRETLTSTLETLSLLMAMNHQSNSQKIQDWALPMLLDPAIPRGLFCVTMWYKCTEVEIIAALLISLSLFSNTADVLQQQLSTQISFIGGSLCWAKPN